jgi:hypothetical protein
MMKPVEQVTAWLFRVARNRIIDLFRKRRFEGLRTDTVALSEDGEPLLLTDLLPSRVQHHTLFGNWTRQAIKTSIVSIACMYSDNIHYTGDKELPAQGCRAVLQDRLQGEKNPAEPCRAAQEAAFCAGQCQVPEGHERAWLEEGHWSVDVTGNWRLTFAFEGDDAVLVDYRDYH